MSWIKVIPYQKAKKTLKKLYDRVKGPNGQIDNILQIHSLRPHTLSGHMSLYKNVLHHRNNTIPKWYLETVGVYVSLLNRCNYCVEHHFAGLQKLIADKKRAGEIKESIQNDRFEAVFTEKETAGLRYARKLTIDPEMVSERDITALKKSGFDDGEILELNQVISYFNYANRTVQGLGVAVDGEILGLSPGDSEEAENWKHS